MPQVLACLLIVSGILFAVPHVAGSTLSDHAPILINGDSDFTASNGVTGGTGTFSDPYVISGWSITGSAGTICIHIVNTSVYFIVENVQASCGNFDTTSSGMEIQGVSNGQILSSSIQGWGEIGEIDSSTNILFSNNQVFTEGGANAPRYGFSITGVTNSTVSGNTFGPASGGDSVHISNSRNDLFSGNTIYPGGCGAQACTSSGATLEIDHSSLITVEGNQMSNGTQCVFSLNYDLSLQILGNTLQGGDVACVVSLERTNSTVISGNLIGPVPPGGSSIWPTVDLSIYYSENDLVTGNNITAEYQGILLGGDTGISVFHNNVINNKVQASDDSTGGNHWDNGYPSGGNYWSDYSGSDPDNDGIGDTPYVFNYSQDSYPLMKLFVASPDPSPSVGGAVVPVDKLALLGPFVLLALPAAAGIVLIALYSKRIKTNKGKMREQSIA
ncbi:MAG TPA: NosD domain-containing protein [Candidatus Bathyarchaeia archaeon]